MALLSPGILASMLSAKDGKEGAGGHKPPFSAWKLLLGPAHTPRGLLGSKDKEPVGFCVLWETVRKDIQCHADTAKMLF